jgi:hypothetical protein
MDSRCNEVLERIRVGLVDLERNLDRVEVTLLEAEERMVEVREARMMERRAWS